ncbi:MAG: efflux RND transporter periplasmic adaptor subunit [Phycisphaerales bacterium]|jgi:multidrug resistance efflux pump
MSAVAPIEIRKESDPRRQRIGRIVSYATFAAALLSMVIVWNQIQRYPRTDDAYLRANTIGMAPRVFGQIAELPIRDNQFVKTGDLLYRIDPRPYEVALARAEANLAVVDFEVRALSDAVQVADARIATSRADVDKAQADIVRRKADVAAAKARADYAADYLGRIKPLLEQQFVTADRVALAESDLQAAKAGVAAAEAAVANADAALVAAQSAVVSAEAEAKRARNALAQVGDVNVRVAAAKVEIADARLNLAYCEVRAPIDGWVTNLNTNVGAFVKTGDNLFSIVQNTEWWVIANFLETEVEQIRVGQEVAVYIYAYPGHRFKGTVQGIGWALYQPNGATQQTLPDVKPALNWIRLAQRFPVRITLEPFDPKYPYRMGATVTAIVKTGGRDPLLEQLGLIGSPFGKDSGPFPDAGSGPTLLPVK